MRKSIPAVFLTVGLLALGLALRLQLIHTAITDLVTQFPDSQRDSGFHVYACNYRLLISQRNLTFNLW